MSRLTNSQLLLGDNTAARDLGYEDAMRDRDLEPGQVPKGSARAAYSAGFARATAAKSADADIHGTGRRRSGAA